MNTQYTTGDIILFQQGDKFMYAQVKDINDNGEPAVEVRDGSQLHAQPAFVYPVAISSLSLQDFGFVFMPCTIFAFNHMLTSCYGFRHNTKLKIYPVSRNEYVIQLLGIEHTANVSNMSDIQHFMIQHLGISLTLADVGDEMPKALTEVQLIDTYSSYILSNDMQKRNAGYNGLADLLSSCVYNVDACHYWIAEYHYQNFRETKSAASKTEALKHYQTVYTQGGYDFLKPRIDSLK